MLFPLVSRFQPFFAMPGSRPRLVWQRANIAGVGNLRFAAQPSDRSESYAMLWALFHAGMGKSTAKDTGTSGIKTMTLTL